MTAPNTLIKETILNIDIIWTILGLKMKKQFADTGRLFQIPQLYIHPVRKIFTSWQGKGTF